MRKPQSLRAQGLLAATMFTFIGSIVCQEELLFLCRMTTRYDQYIYCFDAWFGQPSFYLGRLLDSHHWLLYPTIILYGLTPSVLVFLLIAYYITQPLVNARECLWTTILCLIPAPLLYLVVPVSGPIYAFPTFPSYAPVIHSPQIIHLTSPPNGVPSIHFTLALIVLYFTRKWKFGIVLGVLYVVSTFLSTLGSGEHYIFDLFVAVPYAVLSIYLGQTSSSKTA